MRRQPQQQRSRLMVEQIIMAGFVSLSRYGFEGTTTRHVAEIAGISPGTLYHYFPDKDAIYEAMYGRLVDEIVAELSRLAPIIMGMPLREALQCLIRELMNWLSANDGIYLRAISTSPRFYGRARMPELERALRELGMQFLAHHPDMMPLLARPQLADVLQTCVIAGVIRHLSRPDAELGIEPFANNLVDIVCASIQMAMVTPAA